VRNRFDGSVEALVQTSSDIHSRLLRALERGPRLAHVDRVDVSDEDLDQQVAAGFEIRGDA
jgi:acylphosphatase